MRPTVGTARVFLDAEPERGAHPGFRGELHVDVIGVHLDEECEVLTVPDPGSASDWPMGSWEYLERRTIVPWHRVDCVEWLDPGELERLRAADNCARNGTPASGGS